MEGFYAMYYTGIAGVGHAVIVLKDGIVTGADVSGGVYNGKYVPNDGNYDFEVVLTVAAGSTLVTGQTLSEPLDQEITATLSDNFANGQTVSVQSPMGPVNVVFKKLRDFS